MNLCLIQENMDADIPRPSDHGAHAVVPAAHPAGAAPLADVVMDIPGHLNMVALGSLYLSRQALASARVHTAVDRPIALVHQRGPVVTSVLASGSKRSAASDGSCMLEFRLQRSPHTLEVR